MEFALNHGEIIDGEGASSYVGEQELRCIACAKEVEFTKGKFTHGEKVCDVDLGVKVYQMCDKCDEKFPMSSPKIFFKRVAKTKILNWVEVDKDEYLACFKQKKKLQALRSSKTTCDSCKDLVLDFGKYKGEHVNDVFNEDPGYVLWLRDRCRRKNSEIEAFCETAFDGVCEECFEPHGHKQKWKTLCRECYFN